MPQTPLLLPGVGAQGATPADVARAFTSGPASALVTASRSVIYAFRETEDDWRAAAGAEAERLAAQVWAGLRLVSRKACTRGRKAAAFRVLCGPESVSCGLRACGARSTIPRR